MHEFARTSKLSVGTEKLLQVFSRPELLIQIPAVRPTWQRHLIPRNPFSHGGTPVLRDADGLIAVKAVSDPERF